MAATVIDGKALAAATKAEAAEKVRELKSRGINPCLAVILVGENPASQVYVRGKINDCAQCGIESRSINLPADTTQDALLAEVKKLADDSAVHGILVQLPLPAQIDEKAVIDAIPPEKDVDGFSPVNVGRMQIGEPCYLPCTPAGCIRMIESMGNIRRFAMGFFLICIDQHQLRKKSFLHQCKCRGRSHKSTTDDCCFLSVHLRFLQVNIYFSQLLKVRTMVIQNFSFSLIFPLFLHCDFFIYFPENYFLCRHHTT